MQSQSNPRTFSFEFFPAKTPEGMAKLRTTRQQLAQFKPEFFSVTFGGVMVGTSPEKLTPSKNMTHWLKISGIIARPP